MTSSSELFSSLTQLVRNRRTAKIFDGLEIPKDTLLSLLDLVRWAPNHRLTEPWRFRVLTQPGVQRWIESTKANLSNEELAAMAQQFERVSKAGAVIFVTAMKDAKPSVDRENLAAVSAGVQNLLLGATALGIKTYWSTGKFSVHAETLNFLKITDHEHFVGSIWMGYGEDPKPVPRAPIEDKITWIE